MANPESLDLIDENLKTYRVMKIYGDDGSGNVSPIYSSSGFRPSQYDADLTMDGTAQSVALATGVALGAGRLEIINRGATTKGARVAFGISAADAENNLTISLAAATTGTYWPAMIDAQLPPLGVPALATHYAIANAVAGDTQVVSVTQGL